MTADLLIRMTLHEGRKVVLVTSGDYDRSLRYATPEIDQRGRDVYSGGISGKGVNTPRKIKDTQYGVGKSRNHHLNAVVRHVLPSLGSMLGETYKHKNGNYHGIKASTSKGSNGFEFLGSSAHGKEREVWDEYDRHLTDLANHIHKHIQRMDKKIKVVGMHPTRGMGGDSDTRHDRYEHGGYGFDISHLGEILSAHIASYKYGDMETLSSPTVHDTDADLNIKTGTLDSLKSMLDTFYRGGEYFGGGNLDRKLGHEIALPLKDTEPRTRERLLNSSRKISIPAGWRKKPI